MLAILPALALAVAFVTSLWDPFLGLAVLVAAFAVLTCFPRTRSVPAALIVLPAGLYGLIGSAPISLYRGEIDDQTILMLVVAISLLASGALVGSGFRTGGVWAPGADADWSPAALAVLFVPGALGALWILATTGPALATPTNRFSADPKALLLFETLIPATAVLVYAKLSSGRRLDRRLLWAVGAVCFTVILSGYRGWLIVLLAVLLVLFSMSPQYTIRFRHIAVAAAIGLLVFSGLQAVRRATSTGALLSAQDAGQKYQAEGVPAGLRELHFGFRESIAIGQLLIAEKQSKTTTGAPSLLLADFATVLPGTRPSGGALVAERVGRSGAGGLTPGAVGAVFSDWAVPGFALFALLGLGLGSLWRIASRYGWALPVFAVSWVYVLHWMHRGIPKPMYLVGPLLVAAFLVLWQRRARPGSSNSRPDAVPGREPPPPVAAAGALEGSTR